MKSHIDYERAFESYLRTCQIPYVAVDEAKKATFRDAQLKSFDFIVYSAVGTNWLVDVKGRRWAQRPRQRRPSWENWVTREDLDGLQQWEEVFGHGFGGLLVFAYRLETASSPPPDVLHVYHDTRYVFAGVPLEIYATHARVRSPKWGTVNMPTATFAAHVRPIRDWL